MLIFMTTVWSLLYYASLTLHRDMTRHLGEQQFSIATMVANDITHEFNDRVRALESISRTINPAQMQDRAVLQARLQDMAMLSALFNDGIAIGDTQGTVLADFPPVSGRTGANFAERDYIVGALKHGKPTIGKPVRSKLTGAPSFVIAVPIRDAQGTVIGVFAGVTNLGQVNFLDDIVEHRYGLTGGYLLVDPTQRLIITATDKRRVMQSLPNPAADPLFERFAQGIEGYGVGSIPNGVEVLASAKRIALTGWNVSATLPTAEAFAPLRDARYHFLGAALALSLLAGGLLLVDVAPPVRAHARGVQNHGPSCPIDARPRNRCRLAEPTRSDNSSAASTICSSR